MVFKKTAGFGIAYSIAIIGFINLKLAKNISDIKYIIEGSLSITPFLFSFLILGTLLTLIVDLFKIKNLYVNLLLYLLVGLVVAGLIITGMYKYADITIYVLVTVMIGSIAFYLIGLVNNKKYLALLSIAPILLLCILFLLYK